jgi:hypothetical protein
VALQHVAVLLQVGAPQLEMPAPGVHRAQSAREILLYRPSAADAQDLEVRGDPVGEALQVILELDLAIDGQPRVAAVAQPVDRPRVVQR